MKKTTVSVHGRNLLCTLKPEHGGYSYSVQGPISRVEGWVNGNMKDAKDEARKHAEEKIDAKLLK